MQPDSRSRRQMQAVALAISPVIAIIPVIHSAGFGAAGFASIWPIVFFAPLAMWMESRSITLLLATCNGRHDPFFIAALPIGLVALVGYISCAMLFAFVVPALARMIL